ncbi:twin-arginine translocation pathway signal [Stappia sp. 22II-S9-Z10]|nr:twin-arginine translocation pathway signal [Stappia sp. 22II-S9-Z10]
MCGQCVIDHVRQSMMDRRRLMFGAAAAAAGIGALSRPAPASAQAPTPGAPSGSFTGVADLTHTLSDTFPTFGGAPGFSAEQLYERARDGYNLFILTTDEHTGTHVDAPLHFSADGQSVDEIPAASLVAPLVIVDIAAKAADDPDAMVTPDDLAAWMSAHGEMPDGCCVAMHSGWADKVTGDGFRNADEGGTMHFPGFHPEAAAMLMEDTGAVAIAVDTLSLDHGASADFATHNLWLPSGRYGIECVAGLGALPAAGATLVVGAPKHKGGSGGPARVFALTA